MEVVRREKGMTNQCTPDTRVTDPIMFPKGKGGLEAVELLPRIPPPRAGTINMTAEEHPLNVLLQESPPSPDLCPSLD